MSAGAGSQGPHSQDVDLNLAPIIDCFTVLIAFMLLSASFLAIGVFDAGVAAGGAQAKSPPSVTITVALKPSKRLLLKVSGRQNLRTVIAPTKQDWNFQALGRRLDQLKKRWPKVQAITISASDRIQYREVIRMMEATKKHLPVAILGGF